MAIIIVKDVFSLGRLISHWHGTMFVLFTTLILTRTGSWCQWAGTPHLEPCCCSESDDDDVVLVYGRIYYSCVSGDHTSITRLGYIFFINKKNKNEYEQKKSYDEEEEMGRTQGILIL